MNNVNILIIIRFLIKIFTTINTSIYFFYIRIIINQIIDDCISEVVRMKIMGNDVYYLPCDHKYKYVEKCKINAANGQLGGRPKGSKNKNREKPNGLIENPENTYELSLKSYALSKKYSWKKCAIETLNYLKKIKTNEKNI